MTRFKRLTDAEARSLTRGELLDRIEAEQAYWHRKYSMTAEDRAAEREFRRIMHAYIDPGPRCNPRLISWRGVRPWTTGRRVPVMM